jgi:formylglycine-generating enzyme required for sulfatase activity
MADIFISYKREDRARIAPLARALESRGYTVWWDLELVAGQKWGKKIKAELDAAKCVIVAWTRASVAEDQTYASEWVENEADSAHRRGVLVPVLLDEGRIAWTHQRVQFAALTGWSGDPDHPGVADLMKGVSQHAGVRATPEAVELTAWTQAERTETAEAFQGFLSAFPRSRFAEIARGRAAELEEAAAWSALGSAPTIAALAGFLRRYPAGRFADNAEAKIKALELASARHGRAEPQSPPASHQPSVAPPLRVPRWVFGAAAALVALIAVLIWQPWRSGGASNDPAPIEQTADTSRDAEPAIDQPAPIETLRALRDGQVFRDCADCPEMLMIPAGSFMMGSPESEANRGGDEGPQRRVTIARFAVGKYEVTFDDWAACVNNGGCTSNPNPSDRGWGRGRRPVINVSWNDAAGYVRWLSQRTGERYRLLTEAEWEYAARAGTTTPWSWGGDANAACQYANLWDRTASIDSTATCSDSVGAQTAPVGRYQANAFGLYDMHGNVWEWVQDCYAESYAGAPTNGSAVETSSCSSRVLRGGSWLNIPQVLRSASRYRVSPTSRGSNLGFRLARTV